MSAHKPGPFQNSHQACVVPILIASALPLCTLLPIPMPDVQIDQARSQTGAPASDIGPSAGAHPAGLMKSDAQRVFATS